MTNEKNTETSTPRVFIPQNCSLDYSPAEAYGPVGVLVYNHLSPFSSDIAELIREGLHINEFNPDEDFICLTGQSIILAMALSVTFETYGRVKVLLFDASSNSYKARTLRSVRRTFE